MSVAKEFEAANANYAASFAKGDLQLPPQRYGHLLLLETTPNKSQFNSKVAIVACMDARLDTARALGLEEGDAHVIRNAGGRVTDALRSIVISQQLLGTREIVIIHHTDCGMLTFTDDAIRTKIRDEIQQNADHIAFLPFSDLRKSVLDDVRLVKENPLVLDVPVTGYIYEVESGKIVKVE